jgi:hypothetical protein
VTWSIVLTGTFLNRTVSGDETWCFVYDPQLKRQSATWKSPEWRNGDRTGQRARQCLNCLSFRLELVTWNSSQKGWL